jgi:hypothetical protein
VRRESGTSHAGPHGLGVQKVGLAQSSVAVGTVSGKAVLLDEGLELGVIVG